MKGSDVDMKIKKFILSGTPCIGIKNMWGGRTISSVIRGKGPVLKRSKDSIQIHGTRMSALNLNEAFTSGVWKEYKHPELSFVSPMSFEENAKIIRNLMPLIAEGEVFDEERLLRGAAEFDGKPVKLSFMLSGVGSASLCSVVMYDMDDQYIGFPSMEQIDWMNNQENK